MSHLEKSVRLKNKTFPISLAFKKGNYIFAIKSSISFSAQEHNSLV